MSSTVLTSLWYSILLKSENYTKKKVSFHGGCPKRFIVLSVLLTIAVIQQIRSRVIETSGDGPFGHVVEAGSL